MTHMNIDDIKSKLDELEAARKLATEEGISLLETLALKETKSIIGHEDILEIPEGFNIETNDIYTVISNCEKADTLIVFAHMGVKLPRTHISDLNLSSWKPVVEAMYINRDAGTNLITSEFLKRSKSGEFQSNFKIIFHNLNRNILDVNRIRAAEQIPETPYRGISLWKSEIDKNKISDELGDKFFEKIIEIIKSDDPKLIFQPHTYDVYSGLSTGSDSHDKLKTQGELQKRPASMVVNHYEFETEANGKFGNSDDRAKFNFLSEKELVSIQEILKRNLQKINGVEDNIEVTVDFPYQAPRMLAGLLKKYTNAPQVINEYRKDLFENGLKEIVDSCVEIVRSI